MASIVQPAPKKDTPSEQVATWMKEHLTDQMSHAEQAAACTKKLADIRWSFLLAHGREKKVVPATEDDWHPSIFVAKEEETVVRAYVLPALRSSLQINS